MSWFPRLKFKEMFEVTG